MDKHEKLSRRERQIMDIVYARGRATATEVRTAMPDAPTRTSVRTLLRILEGKGHLSQSRRDVPCMGGHLGPNLDPLLPQPRQRTVLHAQGQRQPAKEVAKVVCQSNTEGGPPLPNGRPGKRKK